MHDTKDCLETSFLSQSFLQDLELKLLVLGSCWPQPFCVEAEWAKLKKQFWKSKSSPFRLRLFFLTEQMSNWPLDLQSFSVNKFVVDIFLPMDLHVCLWCIISFSGGLQRFPGLWKDSSLKICLVQNPENWKLYSSTLITSHAYCKYLSIKLRCLSAFFGTLHAHTGACIYILLGHKQRTHKYKYIYYVKKISLK